MKYSKNRYKIYFTMTKIVKYKKYNKKKFESVNYYFFLVCFTKTL